MAHPSSLRRLPVGLVAAGSALILSVGGGVAWWTWQSWTPPAPKTASHPTLTHPENAQPTANQAANLQSVRVFWLQEQSQKLTLSASTIPVAQNATPQDTLTTALNQLLAGPKTKANVTTIPPQTQLRSLKLEKDGIHIDLSREFTTGGGSTSMTGRVAQVLYTATSLDPKAAVWLTIEGKPLEVLGGEGLLLNQPLTRSEFDRDFSL